MADELLEDWVCCDGCDGWKTFEEAGITSAPSAQWFCSALCESVSDSYSSAPGVSTSLTLNEAPEPPSIFCLGIITPEFVRCNREVPVSAGFCSMHTIQAESAMAERERQIDEVARDKLIQDYRYFSCPITQELLKDPFKGSCRHLMDKSSLLKLALEVGTANEFPCPISDCLFKWNLLTSTQDFDSARKVADFKKRVGGPEALKALQDKARAAPSSSSTYKKECQRHCGLPLSQEDSRFVDDWMAWVTANQEGLMTGVSWSYAPLPLLPRVAYERERAAALERADICMIVDTGISPQDFVCPVSGAIMSDPMTNGKCIHRVDRDSLVAYCGVLSAAGPAKKHCPVVGCNQLWSIAGARPDAAFCSCFGILWWSSQGPRARLTLSI